MSPDEFAELQRAIAANAAEQNTLLRQIRDAIKFHGWALVIVFLLILSVVASQR